MNVSRLLICCTLLVIGGGWGPMRGKDTSDAFFAGPIVQLELRVDPEDAEAINRDERPYVPCTLIERDRGGKKTAEYPHVAIKVKGAAGSFARFEDKPALTVRTDKTVNGQTFHSLTKFHLNNSVQDDSYLHEQICSELFLDAKVPQPVEFDDRGILQLTDWHPASEVEFAVLEEVELPSDRRAFKIASVPGNPCVASWRTHVLLPHGRYTFIAVAQSRDLRPLEDEKGVGAGLRISGLPRENRLVGSSERQELRFEFSVEEDSRQVEFVAELRAESGEVEFVADSLQLHRE
ncbi:MAG: CotH kinase family protein [Pirellulales bacterium]